MLTSLHPGITTEQAVAATGWPLRVADDVSITDEPTELELSTLRALAGGVSIMRFTYDALPGRIVFGAGRRSEVGARGRAPRRARACSSSPTVRPRRSPTSSPARSMRSSPPAGTRSCNTSRSSSPIEPAPRSPRPVPTCVVTRRRRLVDRAGQGDRPDHGAADRRRADDLRRQRADHHLRAHRRTPQADRPRSRRAPEGRDLRPRADARPAAGRHRTERVQRARPLGRGAVGARRPTR